jgi:hypothetical protein
VSITAAVDEIHEAVYEALTGDATLMAIVTGVYSNVPDAQAYPYVEIGETTSNSVDSLDKQKRAVVVTIHSWSRYQGQKQCWQIIARLETLLHRTAVSVDGVTLERAWVESSNVFQDPDGETYHGVTRFAIQVSA